MSNRATFLALTLVLGPVLGACDSGVSLFEPDADVSFVSADAADVTIDLAALDGGSEDGSLFDELSEQIPGFGGFWFDRGCNLNVVLTDAGQADRATEILTPYLERYIQTHDCPRTASVVIHRGDYTWKQLSSWLRKLAPATGFRGVERMGISIPANRLVFAVTGRPAAKEVLRLAQDNDVPASAIKFTLATSGTSRDGQTRTGDGQTRSRG